MALDQSLGLVSDINSLLLAQHSSEGPERRQESLELLVQATMRAQSAHSQLMAIRLQESASLKEKNQISKPPPVPKKPAAIRFQSSAQIPDVSDTVQDGKVDLIPETELAIFDDSSETSSLAEENQSLPFIKASKKSLPLLQTLHSDPLDRLVASPLDTPQNRSRSSLSELRASTDELFIFKKRPSMFPDTPTMPEDVTIYSLSASKRMSSDPPTVPRSALIIKYEALLLATTTEKGNNDAHKKPPLPPPIPSNPLSKANSPSVKLTSKKDPLSRAMQLIHLSASVAEISHLRPIYVAFQLTLIEQSIFMGIKPHDFSTHRPPLHPEPSIGASSMFFNYFSRTVERTILEPFHQIGRARAIESWVKVAKNLYEFRNFQTLKAVVSALGTPPISRLRQTWAVVDKKRLHDLKALLELMSERDNYSAYRKWLKLNIARPMIPYIGIYLHDMTYLLALQSREGLRDISLAKMLQDIVIQIKFFQSEPHYTATSFSAAFQGGGVIQNLYTKPKKTPITSFAPEELQALNQEDDETVADFINHWILTQKWVTEKAIDELSLEREAKLDVRLSPTIDSSRTGSGPPSRGVPDCRPTESNESLPSSDAHPKASLATLTYLGGKTILDSIKSTTRKVIHRTKSSDLRHKQSHSGDSGRSGYFHIRNGSADSKADEETISGSETSLALSIRSDLPTSGKLITK